MHLVLYYEKDASNAAKGKYVIIWYTTSLYSCNTNSNIFTLERENAMVPSLAQIASNGIQNAFPSERITEVSNTHPLMSSR